jgi:P-aminobenzoate N-oxygenase AurF
VNRFTASIDACFTWDFGPQRPRLRDLYEQSKQAQWNATTDIDWAIEVEFYSSLPDDSLYATTAFEASPLARHGPSLWQRFRWELQSWLVCQFLYGEQGALIAAARLAQVLPQVDAKFCAASQAADEARHMEVFSQYIRQNVPNPYAVSAPLAALFDDLVDHREWDLTALGIQVVVEPLALAAFRLASNTFHDDLIKQITRFVANDEARHMAFGILLLEDLYRDLSEAERAYREELVLDAAALMSRRFLLEEIWDRLGVEPRVGVEFASNNPMMVAYRQTIFSKVVSSLARIGLMTERVRDGLAKLGLLSVTGRRVIETGLHTKPA